MALVIHGAECEKLISDESHRCETPSVYVCPKASLGTAGRPGGAGAAPPLALLRRPAIGLGAGSAHQQRPFTVAQALRLAEGLDGLLVVDDGERTGPVGAPQAALEPPGLEHAGQRVPDVREGIRFLGQRAGAADFEHRVLALRER